MLYPLRHLAAPGELYTYTIFRDNFIWIRDAGWFRAVPYRIRYQVSTMDLILILIPDSSLIKSGCMLWKVSSGWHKNYIKSLVLLEYFIRYLNYRWALFSCATDKVRNACADENCRESFTSGTTTSLYRHRTNCSWVTELRYSPLRLPTTFKGTNPRLDLCVHLGWWTCDYITCEN